MAMIASQSILAGWIERRIPWVGIVVFGLGLLAAATGWIVAGGTYGLRDIPMQVISLIGRYII